MKEDDKAFLVLFFGITPFCIFGIHDFVMEKTKRAIFHLVLFFMVFVLTMCAPLLETLRDVGFPQLYNLVSLIDTPETVFNNAIIILMGTSYLTSIFEIIAYFRARKEEPQLVPPPEKPEDPFTHDEEY